MRSNAMLNLIHQLDGFLGKQHTMNLYKSKVKRLLKAPVDHPSSDAALEVLQEDILSCTVELLEHADITVPMDASANANTTQDRIIECLLVNGFVVVPDFFMEGGMEGSIALKWCKTKDMASLTACTALAATIRCTTLSRKLTSFG